MVGPSDEGEPAATMDEVPQLGLGTEEMASSAAAPGGDVETLDGRLGDLKLDAGEDGDGGGQGLVTPAEVEEGGTPTEGEGSVVNLSPPCAVSGVKEAEVSEAEMAWRGEQEWREETEVAKEGAGEEQVGEDGAQEEEEKDKEGQSGKVSFPQRPGEPDCAYYLKTGLCGFGANCKFNHPQRGRRIHVVKSSDLENFQVKEKEKEEYRGNVSQIRCKYYQTPGGCKYGSNCRYKHGERLEAGPELNLLGLPMRPGEKDCPFFLRTGSCKFGANCRFHHPNPTGVDEQPPVAGFQDNASSQQHASGGVSQPPKAAWSLQRCSNQSVSFIDTSPSCVTGMLLPHQLHQNPEWNGYQAPPVQTMYKPTSNMNGHSGPLHMQTEEYPERPGQPDCQYYMDNGTCRYKSACRFHHPKDRLARSPMCLLSPMGLPLRPDQPVCTYYGRYGICKFGPTCRYNHPMDRGSSKTHPQTNMVLP